jgi:hypothetical protein
MKRFTLILLMLVSGLVFKANAQEATVNEKLSEVNDKVNGLTERLATDEADLQKLAKIKVSGYIQAQWQNYENLNTQPSNFFSLRRVRVKFTYEAADGVKFVLCPDFSPGNFALKDAYVVLNDRWTKSFSLWAGKFNRPNYEVEYSSSQREIAERSKVIGTLYPGERAIGAKLEFNPQSLPIHVQLALLNGNEDLIITNNTGAELNNKTALGVNKDFDNYKDIMLRATYNLSLGSFGGLDFGAHGYFGSLKSLATQTLSSDYTTVKDVKFGDAVKRNWVGGEFQLFADVLGGLSIKGEYIAGKNASIGYASVPAAGTTAAVPGVANFQNKFAGYYLYFIKNLGKKNQFAFRYDYYDPNTDVTGKDVNIKKFTPADATILKSRTVGKGDLATSTFGFALHHYFDDNIRISLNYDIVQNEKVGSTAGVSNLMENYTKADGTVVKNGLDYTKNVNNNLLTLRLQAKF